MGDVTHVRSRFGRKSSPRSIHAEEWPGQRGKARVLIENPDGADLWAHAEILRKAGYEVATCVGPTAEPERVPWLRRIAQYWADPEPKEHLARTLCPLISEGHCPLAEGADVVVSTARLTDGREILATLSGMGTPALVVEGTGSDLERDRDVLGNAVEIRMPISPHQLVEAVERARSQAAEGRRARA
jgi:hypothetical protein